MTDGSRAGNATTTLQSELRSFPINDAQVALWAIRRSGDHRSGYRYEAAAVAIDARVEGRLRGILRDHMAVTGELREYEYIVAQGTEDASRPSVLPVSDCEIGNVRAALGREGGGRKSKWQPPVGAWGYVLQAKVGARELLGFRATQGAWTAKRSRVLGILPAGSVYALVEQEGVLRIEDALDCAVSGDSVVIFDRARFERALDFRLTIRRHAHGVLETKIAPLLADGDAERLRDAIGDRLSHLRRLASLKHAEYLTPDFPTQLRRVCESSPAWNLQFTDTGRIRVDPENVDELLSALGVNRLHSPVTDKLYDVDVKRESKRKQAAVALVGTTGSRGITTQSATRSKRSGARKTGRPNGGDSGQEVA